MKDIHLITFLALMAFSAISTLYAIFTASPTRSIKMPLVLAAISMITAMPIGAIHSSETNAEMKKASYHAWVKHTTNPNHLTFDEWQALNNSYIPHEN